MYSEDRLLLFEYLAEKRLINAPIDFKTMIGNCRTIKHNLYLLKVMKEAYFETLDQAIGFYTDMLEREEAEINKRLERNNVKIIDTDTTLTIHKTLR